MRLYQVDTKHFCAGFVLDDEDNLIECAPILRKKFNYWKTKAVLIKGDLKMAKQYVVKFIEYNQKMSGKYDGAYLSTEACESGTKRKDFVFANSPIFKVLQKCEKGTIVELKIVKNGDFFNLAKDDDAITIVEGATKKESTDNQGVSIIPSGKTYGGERNNPDVQSAIIRQNGLTNAVNLVTAMLANGYFNPKETTITQFTTIITQVANNFAKFSSGETVIEELIAEIEPKAKAGRKPKPPQNGDRDDDDAEFGE